jgi:hypothetical protein
MIIFVGVLLFFGALITLGILISTYFYNSGAIGRRRFRIRRRANSIELLPVESEPGELVAPIEVEEEIIDVP